MNINLESIRDEIKKHNVSSKLKAEKYEQLKCWSYAYLARWVVLESGVKALYDLHNRECIRRVATEWLEYLDGKRKNAPKQIKNFTVQTKSIPRYESLKIYWVNVAVPKMLWLQKNKYRSRRNHIAHKAEEFR